MATMRKQMNPQVLAALAARARMGGAPVAGVPGGPASPAMPGPMGAMGGAPAPAPTSMKKGGKTKKMAKGGVTGQSMRAVGRNLARAHNQKPGSK